MKRTFTLFAAAILALVCADSCRKAPKPEPTPVEPTEFTEFSDAGALYYGPFGNYNFDMFCTYLLTGQTRVDDGTLSGVGSALWLDMNVEQNADKILAIAQYEPARNDYAINAFLKGSTYVDDNGNEVIAGSYVYYRPLNGTAQYHLITNGTVSVNITGKNYSIKAKVLADGTEYTFDYFGYFSYTDMYVPDPDPDPSGDTEITTMTHGRIEKLGQIFNNDKITDYCDWNVLLGDNNYDFDNGGSGKELQFELITKKDATDIVGTYTVKTKDFTSDTMAEALVPGSALCGYIEEDGGQNYYYGCWYFPGETGWLGATTGTVEVSKNGTTYTIKFDMTDEYTDGSPRYYGSYTGKMEMKAESAPARASRVASVDVKNNTRRGTSTDRRAATAR